VEGKGGGDRARPRGSLLPLPLEPFFSPSGGADCGGCCWEPDRGAGGFVRGIQDCRPPQLQLQLQLQGRPVSFLELAASSPCPVVPLLVWSSVRPSVRPSARPSVQGFLPGVLLLLVSSTRLVSLLRLRFRYSLFSLVTRYHSRFSVPLFSPYPPSNYRSFDFLQRKKEANSYNSKYQGTIVLLRKVRVKSGNSVGKS
jgi:hypothetical protein